MFKKAMLLVGLALAVSTLPAGSPGELEAFETHDWGVRGLPPYCRQPGDLDGTGEIDIKDFAVFQRCLWLSHTAPGCSVSEFLASDLVVDNLVDLHDYAAFVALAWPPPMTIDCGPGWPSWWIERCGMDCLPDGDVVQTGTPVVVTPRQPQPGDGSGIRKVELVRDYDTLAALVDPAPLGVVDFDVFEVIIFTTTAAAEGSCWDTVHCYNGTIDLADERRAIDVGFVQRGKPICMVMPWTVTRAVVAPRSNRPVVMLFIEIDGQVTQTAAALCE